MSSIFHVVKLGHVALHLDFSHFPVYIWHALIHTPQWIPKWLNLCEVKRRGQSWALESSEEWRSPLFREENGGGGTNITGWNNLGTAAAFSCWPADLFQISFISSQALPLYPLNSGYLMGVQTSCKETKILSCSYHKHIVPGYWAWHTPYIVWHTQPVTVRGSLFKGGWRPAPHTEH